MRVLEGVRVKDAGRQVAAVSYIRLVPWSFLLVKARVIQDRHIDVLVQHLLASNRWDLRAADLGIRIELPPVLGQVDRRSHAGQLRQTHLINQLLLLRRFYLLYRLLAHALELRGEDLVARIEGRRVWLEGSRVVIFVG